MDSLISTPVTHISSTSLAPIEHLHVHIRIRPFLQEEQQISIVDFSKYKTGQLISNFE